MVRPDICYEGLVSRIHGTSHVESRWAGSPSVHLLYFSIVSCICLCVASFSWNEILLLLVTAIFTCAKCLFMLVLQCNDWQWLWILFCCWHPQLLAYHACNTGILGMYRSSRGANSKKKKYAKSLSAHWGSDPLNISATPFSTQSSYSDQYQACSSRVFSSSMVQKSSWKLFQRENRKQHPRCMILIWLPNVLDSYIKYT